MKYEFTAEGMIEDLRSTNFDDIIALRKAVRHVIGDIKGGYLFDGNKVDPVDDALKFAYQTGLEFAASLRRLAMEQRDPTTIGSVYWAALTACLDLRAKILERDKE
jgi:hypothetical protein